MKTYVRVALVIGISVASLSPLQAETIFGVTTTGSLRFFDSLSPGNQTTIGNVSGLIAGHTLRGIDFRPSTGELYGISTDGPAGATVQIYTINLGSAVAST